MTGPKGNSEFFRRCLDLWSTSITLRTCSSLICNASVEFQKKIRKISLRRLRSPKYARTSFHVVVLQRTAKKCTKIYDARAQTLFCSLNLLFCSVLVAFAVVVCGIKPPKRRLSDCYFVGNTLTRTEAIEIYTPNDVTSSSSRKTTIAFFANFGGIEKLFCVREQSLN